jgi:hypothetical protein
MAALRFLSLQPMHRLGRGKHGKFGGGHVRACARFLLNPLDLPGAGDQQDAGDPFAIGREGGLTKSGRTHPPMEQWLDQQTGGVAHLNAHPVGAEADLKLASIRRVSGRRQDAFHFGPFPRIVVGKGLADDNAARRGQGA